MKETFGDDDYQAHLDKTHEYRLKENETTFLWDMVELGRIGLQEGEDLKYEETFASWQKVEDLHKKDEESAEDELEPLEDLIESYFNHQPDNHLNKMLFVVADFGKGKSVFLKHYAAVFAKKYLETSEGYFPVYLNLRNFGKYDDTTRLGVISDFLASDYGIKIEDDHFKAKRYIFLIDSLDESGELSKPAIERVVSSVKSIQHLDKADCRTNRIIMTSRPFDEGLRDQIRNYQPHIINNEDERSVEYFASIYGFKKDQFNDWLTATLKGSARWDRAKATGFVKDIIAGFDEETCFDAYEQLTENKTLSQSELRRPIFGYMIFQLIINNVDFQNIGKIGVYLSFLNLLTKEAKHIDDVRHINLADEFKFRNILHAIAALWMYQRQQGKQGALHKADICRVLDGERRQGESDNETITRFKDEDVTDIQFLSHSYFGEKDNLLHFQHQSFAEILLAEYYLKVFIKYALEKKSDPEEARTKLILGEPTGQTIQFLKELLLLLRDAAVDSNSDEVIEKRRLLFPLMAALATEEQNTLFSNTLCLRWYEDNCEIEDNQSEYPRKALENWCIDQKSLAKIVDLAAAIMESNTNYVMTKVEVKTALFDKEVLVMQNNKLSKLPPDIDRWLALLVGNILVNDVEEEVFFNERLRCFENIFDLVKNWNYAFGIASPYWGRELFQGIDMKNNEEVVNICNLDLDHLNFSNSHFNKVNAFSASFRDCIFYNITFEDVDFRFSDFLHISKITVKSIIGRVDFMGAILLRNWTIPAPIQRINKGKRLAGRGLSLLTESNVKTYGVTDFLTSLLIYSLKQQLLTVDEIKSWFIYEPGKTEELFLKAIGKLQKYEILPPANDEP
ncbi:MAG: hypothetical protein HRT35_12870 [Algicola sp.]|nr:hypothetical protein [Algicola sp.]